MGDVVTGLMYAIAAALILAVALAGAALWYSLGVPGRSHRGPLPAASAEEMALAERLKRHVVAIASKPHNVRYFADLEAAAAYIEQTLTAMGYRVASQSYVADGRTVRNLEVSVEPAGAVSPPRTLIVGAHYDSAGDAPGANDNATGTAAVIELARLLKDARLAQRIRLVLFVNEEPPYFKTPEMGSARYAQSLADRNEPVAGMIALETLGFFSDQLGSQRYPWPLGLFFPDRADFIAFVGMPGSRGLLRRAIGAFRAHTAFPSIGGIAPGAIPGIDWSDHWSFARHGMPAIMITDTALFRYAHYHWPTDTPDKVDTEKLARITKGLERAIRALAR